MKDAKNTLLELAKTGILATVVGGAVGLAYWNHLKGEIYVEPKPTDATGGTAGTTLVAPAGASYTTDELKANFATIAAALNS